MKLKDEVVQQNYINGNELLNKTNNNWRKICINDLEGFDNGDIFEYDNNLYILIGAHLVRINGSIAIPANLELLKQIKKINLIDYLISSTYLEEIQDTDDYIISQDNLLDKLLYLAYSSFISEEAAENTELLFNQKDSYNEEPFPIEFKSFLFNLNKINLFPEEYEFENQQLKDSTIEEFKNGKPFELYEETTEISESDPTYIKLKEEIIGLGKKNNYITYEQLVEKFKEIDVNTNILNDLYESLVENGIEVILEGEKRGENTNEPQDYKMYSKISSELSMNYKKHYGGIKQVTERIKKNGNVLKQLKSGISVLSSFFFNDCTIIEDNYMCEYKPKIYRSDYSFLIINFIKAVEIFFAYKLSKFDGQITINVKKEINGEIEYKQELTKLNSVEFKKNVLLSQMISYVLNHQEQTIDSNIDEEQRKRFIRELTHFKDNDRNGYFHKDSVSSINKTLSIIIDALQLLVGIEMYLKNGDNN